MQSLGFPQKYLKMATSGEKSRKIDDQPLQKQPQVELVTASQVDIHPPQVLVERPYAKLASGKGNQSCGYECEFVQPPPEALQTDCSICLLVLREPHLISCCGHNFCRVCIGRIKTEGKSCPLCNATKISVMHNKGLERSLKDFEVRCTHAASGCEWVGKLGLLDNHLNLNPDLEKQLEGCGFVEIACNNKCGGVFSRCMLANHQREECPKRPYSCDYCREYVSTFEDVISNHYPQCKCYPLSCPNQCTPYAIERQHFADHLSYDCPLTVVNCDFHYAGCKVQVPRKDMPAHLRENFTHVSLLATMNRKLTEKLLKKDEEISKLSQESKETMAKLGKKDKEQTFCIDSLKKHQQQMEQEISELKSELTKKHDESVYELSATLRQEIDRNREERAAMKQEIRLEMDHLKKKQASDAKDRLQDTTDMREKQEQDRTELHKKQKRHQQQLGQEISELKSELTKNHDESVHELTTTLRQEIDMLKQKQDEATTNIREEKAALKREIQLEMDQLKMKQATDTKSLVRDMTDTKEKQEQDRTELNRQATALQHVNAHIGLVPFQITMPDFETHKAAADEWYSEPFSTHPGGYKMCLCVYANGHRTAKRTHISVYVYLMRGMFDEHLKWPILCDITIELLNQKEGEGNCGRVIAFGDRKNNASRVTKGERAVGGWGILTFISHAELYSHRDDFINNGCICFQITKFEHRK